MQCTVHFIITLFKAGNVLLYGAETWRLTEINKRRIQATEMDALRRSSRISIKDKIRNTTIRQQIGI
jgi:hypothetical protein